jgi:hypothetical protein
VQFADTSILLYAISRDPAEQDKAKRANDILAGCDLALSCPKTWVTARTTPGSGSPIRSAYTRLKSGSFSRLPRRSAGSRL